VSGYAETRGEREEWDAAFAALEHTDPDTNATSGSRRDETTRTNSRGFHQVARRCRSRNSTERVTRREGVHRGAACLAMLRGAMTALASPPSSPPKQPPPPPRLPTLVPLVTLRCPARSPDVPADAAASTATTHPSLLLVSFQPSAALQPPTVPRGRPSCLGPTNAILIGRKGGIQERKDLSREPRGDRPTFDFFLFSQHFFRGFFSSSYVPTIPQNCFFTDALRLIFSLLRGRSLFGEKMVGRRGDISEITRGALRADKIRNFVVADLRNKCMEFPSERSFRLQMFALAKH